MSEYPISIIINAIDKASKEFGVVTDSVAALEAEVKQTARTVRPLGIALTAAGVAGLTLATSSVLLAARSEELGVVLDVLGENIGYTAEQIDKYKRGVQDLGITSIATSQSMVRMIQANIDLASASDLARLAQDAAVVGQLDSSEAFERLIMVIQRGSPLMARRLGLNVDFNHSYKEQAKLLGITVGELTQKHRVDARVNAVMEAGVRIMGAYEAAMTTSAKLLRSLNRLWVEARIALGDGLLPVMGEAVETTTWLLESFNALEPVAKSLTGSVLGLTSSIALLSGGFILLAPKLVATITLLKAMPAFFSALASAMSPVAATTAVLSGGTLTLGASLAVLAPPVIAATAVLAALARTLHFVKEKALGYNAMQDQLVTTLEEEIEAGTSAADVVQIYADRRAHASKIIQEASWFTRLFIDDQKVMTLSYEELLAIVGENITTAEEFAAAQELIQAATAETTEGLSTLAKTIDLVSVGVDIFKQTYSEATNETSFLDKVTNALGTTLDYVANALGDVDQAHTDLTQRNQVLGTSFDDLQRAIREETEALEAEADAAAAAVMSSELLMANLNRAMDWTAILQKQQDYLGDRAKTYREAHDEFIALEEEHNQDRANILRTSEEALSAAFRDYTEDRADALQTSEEELLALSRNYQDDKARMWETHQGKLASISSSYQLREERLRQDTHRRALEEERDFQRSREEILLTTKERIAEINAEHDSLLYETAENQADRALLFRADAARAEERAQEAIDSATDDLQRRAAELRLKLLREENAEKLKEILAGKEVLEGITEEERDKLIAEAKEERDLQLALLEERYAQEALLQKEKLDERLARMKEDGKLALDAEKTRVAERLDLLEEAFIKKGLAQEEYLSNRLLALDEGWEEEQTKEGIHKTALLEQEAASYELSKTQTGEYLTTRLATLEEGWDGERLGWEKHWSKLELGRLATQLKNEELTSAERAFLEESARDIAAQFALVTPEAQTFANTEIAIRDATNQATDALWDQSEAMKELFGAMGGETDIPTYQSGTRYVPRTGLAMLHEGEAVLPRNEAARHQQGEQQSGRGASIVIHGGLVLQGVQNVASLLEELQKYTIGEEYGF